MPSPRDKWIRSINDNTAGRVVADDEGNRWQWDSDDPTAHLLKKLSNDELAIEQTDLHPVGKAQAAKAKGAPTDRATAGRASPKPGARDAGGGFDPYDHAGKPRRR